MSSSAINFCFIFGVTPQKKKKKMAEHDKKIHVGTSESEFYNKTKIFKM